MAGNNISFSNSKTDSNNRIQQALPSDLWKETWIEWVSGRLPQMTDMRQVLDLACLHLTADPAEQHLSRLLIFFISPLSRL